MNIDLLANAFGTLFATIGLYNLWRASSKSKWGKADGKILISRITPLSDDEFRLDFPNAFSSYRPGKRLKFKSGYAPNLVYHYNLLGKEYLGSAYYSAPLWLLNVSKLRFLTEGASQTVRYNMENPSESYLFESPKLPSILLIILGATMFGHVFLFEALNTYFDF